MGKNYVFRNPRDAIYIFFYALKKIPGHFKLGALVSAEPLPLMDLCRRVIRQQVSRPRIEQGHLDRLNLPKPVKEYLQYKERRYYKNIAVSSLCLLFYY